MREIKESDWKIFKKLKNLALERFCKRTLSSVSHLIADTNKTQHERYLAVYGVIKERDRIIASAFNGLSRSKAYHQLSMILELELLLASEISRFSPELQEWISSFLQHCELSRNRTQ